MAGVYSALRGFALAHPVCGELRGDRIAKLCPLTSWGQATSLPA